MITFNDIYSCCEYDVERTVSDLKLIVETDPRRVEHFKNRIQELTKEKVKLDKILDCKGLAESDISLKEIKSMVERSEEINQLITNYKKDIIDLNMHLQYAKKLLDAFTNKIDYAEIRQSIEQDIKDKGASLFGTLFINFSQQTDIKLEPEANHKQIMEFFRIHLKQVFSKLKS